MIRLRTSQKDRMRIVGCLPLQIKSIPLVNLIYRLTLRLKRVKRIKTLESLDASDFQRTLQFNKDGSVLVAGTTDGKVRDLIL